jgi:hypothetical protein
MLNVNTKTVYGYLKRGKDIWDWVSCPEDIKVRKRARPVAIFKDGNLLFKFSSILELSENSFKFFGTKLCYSSILRYINNGKKYLEFEIKYI